MFSMTTGKIIQNLVAYNTFWPEWMQGLQRLRVESAVLLLLCPGCGDGQVQEEGQSCHRSACNTCPYVHVASKVTKWKYLKPKEVDDVLGGEAAWVTADSAEICPTREHPCVYFM